MEQTYKTPYVRHNGAVIDRDQATDHHVMHGLHYGTSVFEGIRFYPTDHGPKIFRLQEHIERLFYSAATLSMQMEFTQEQWRQACIELVHKNSEQAGYIRPIVYYGTGKMGIYPAPGLVDVESFISVWKRGKYLSEDPISVKITATRRIHPATSDMRAKISGHYANSTLVTLEVRKAGYQEGLLLDTDGYVAEGPGENIFFVRDREVVTPKVGTILPGITRATVIQLFAEQFGSEVVERKVHPDELANFDGAFFVGTAAEVTPIGSITKESEEKIVYSYTPTSITMQMKNMYEAVVRGKKEEYLGWLS